MHLHLPCGLDVRRGQVRQLGPRLQGGVSGPVDILVHTAPPGLEAGRLLLFGLASLSETFGDVVVSLGTVDLAPESDVSCLGSDSQLLEGLLQEKRFILTEANPRPLVDSRICLEVRNIAARSRRGAAVRRRLIPTFGGAPLSRSLATFLLYNSN